MEFKVTSLAMLVASALASPVALAETKETDAEIDKSHSPEVMVVVGELTNVSVTDTELENYQAQDLEDIFRTDPSVTVGGSIGVAQKVYVRGLEDTYLNVTVDGAPQTSTLFHHIGRLSIDPYLLKTVEVQAGAGEATSGFGALGGSIRFKTKSAHDLLAPGESFGGRVSANYFTNDGYAGSASAYGEINDNWGILGSFVQTKNENMTDGNGDEIYGSSSDRALGFIKIDGDLTDNQTLAFSYENRNEKGEFGQRPNWPATATDPLYPLETQRHTFTANHTFSLNDLLNLENTVYYTQADVTQDARWGKYNGEVNTIGLDVRNTTYIQDHAVTYGIEYRSDEAVAKSLEPGAGPKVNEDGDVFGVYAQDHWQLADSFLLSFGTRYDRYTLKQHSTGTEIDSDGLSSNVGFNYQIIDGLKLNAGYAQALRGKQVGDTFTLDVYTINPDLKAETAENAEIGLEYRQENWLASATVFQSTIDDVIDVDGRQYENVGTLKTKGYELRATYWFEKVTAMASFSSVDSELNGQTLNGYDHVGIGNSRGDTLGLNLTYNMNQHLELGWNYSYVADLNNVEVKNAYVADGSSIDKPGYQVHDIYVQWYPLNSQDLNVNLTVTNLFNEYYRDHSSVGDFTSLPGFESVAGVYAAGRDIRVGVSYAF
ncbi:TonB-dependent receptor [Vibrio sp. UCD-FRSSP16_10]|uniref:TonB-dependent receptor domain-containing protein n=1 Tax=unclassified Vibrio TaxID=2614977 RepID=UPI0007FE1FEB|nr:MULTISPECIES: TonB-dependent receptor [unclassified Vibrio]OBT13851.1 TonB-dependent receptor [Vibrio sp. UCD-FRSSP16_30]OBT22732.1 TonB-dependent receptor [Vibrio sp. UCD-FRSSP16_10]